MKEIDEDEILGALARGYCSVENENKTLDATLIKAQTKEIMEYLENR